MPNWKKMCAVAFVGEPLLPDALKLTDDWHFASLKNFWSAHVKLADDLLGVSKLKNAEDKNRTLEADIKMLTEAASDKDKELMDANSNLKEANSNLKEANSNLTAKDQKMKEAAEKIESLEKNVSEKDEQLQKANERIEVLENYMNELFVLLTSKQQDLGTIGVDEKVTDARKEIERLKIMEEIFNSRNLTLSLKEELKLQGLDESTFQ